MPASVNPHLTDECQDAYFPEMAERYAALVRNDPFVQHIEQIIKNGVDPEIALRIGIVELTEAKYRLIKRLEKHDTRIR